MSVVAIDLGRNAGVALGPPGRVPTCETLALPDAIGAGLSRLEGFLRGVLRSHPVSLLAYEAPFLMFGRPSAHATNHAYRSFGQAAAILKLAHEFGVAPVAFQVRSVRKQFAGGAKARPDAILRAALSCGARPANDHEADAVLIWMAATAQARKEAA